ncbi:MAG: S-methyl-5-thioribose-1-phosphate isomerase [Deltaproteobacteria bacterium]|nr:S-methyl-5-thioribose-1-phosphate isomerase [Deltaproteobacteria bacterium]
MRIDGTHYRSIWLDPSTGLLRIVDQAGLPHRFSIRTLETFADVCRAIRDMQVRGAPLIGATAAHGLALALRADPSDEMLARAIDGLLATRPTAVDLRWAMERMRRVLLEVPSDARARRAVDEARLICDEGVETCRAIGRHGFEILAARFDLERPSGEPLRVLTHCNAGWLATVDRGTALAPIYEVYDAGLPIHVWVDETRPRNQGASLTAFELREHGVPHSVIVDNAGGHLMQRGLVDVVIVGSDRTTATGDVCNKIGTYLKALAAKDNEIPFYVALPTSSIDWTLDDGLAQIPIEERDGSEVREITGRGLDGEIATVELFSEESPVSNPAFDITPARFVSGLITEHGVFDANEKSLEKLKRLAIGR